MANAEAGQGGLIEYHPFWQYSHGQDGSSGFDAVLANWGFDGGHFSHATGWGFVGVGVVRGIIGHLLLHGLDIHRWCVLLAGLYPYEVVEVLAESLLDRCPFHDNQKVIFLFGCIGCGIPDHVIELALGHVGGAELIGKDLELSAVTAKDK